MDLATLLGSRTPISVVRYCWARCWGIVGWSWFLPIVVSGACSSGEGVGAPLSGGGVIRDGGLGGSSVGGSSGNSASGGNNGLGGAGTGGAGVAGSGGAGNTGGSGGTPGPESHLVVVAHQDDDLLFINPDLKRLIDSGSPLVVAYLTSGNAGDGMSYVQEREAGIKSAYAYMAEMTNAWTCTAKPYGAKTIQTCALGDQPNVTALFFRLVDGFADGSDPQSLFNLWKGATATSAAVDGSGLQFTRQELIDTLLSVLGQHNVISIRTLDFSFLHGPSPVGDHSDHEYASLFATAASAAYGKPHSLIGFRTYNISDEAANLSQADVSMKTTVFERYAACDQKMPPCAGGSTCDQGSCRPSSTLYPSWNARQYFHNRRTPPINGPISNVSATGQCLAAPSGNLMNTGCTGGSDQTWTWASDFTLRNAAGNCLTAPALNLSTTPTTSACTGARRQRWFVMDDGQIQMAAPPEPGEEGIYTFSRCIQASSGAVAELRNCAPTSSQYWRLGP